MLARNRPAMQIGDFESCERDLRSQPVVTSAAVRIAAWPGCVRNRCYTRLSKTRRQTWPVTLIKERNSR